MPVQVQLQYPAPASRPGGAKPDVRLSGDLPAFEAGAERPTFGALLAASLRQQSESRIWFEDIKKYQLAQQTRSPVSLPEVSCHGGRHVQEAKVAALSAHARLVTG